MAKRKAKRAMCTYIVRTGKGKAFKTSSYSLAYRRAQKAASQGRRKSSVYARCKGSALERMLTCHPDGRCGTGFRGLTGTKKKRRKKRRR